MDIHIAQQLIAPFLPALKLDAVIGVSKRKWVRQIFSTIFFALLLVVLTDQGGDKALGFFFIAFALTICSYCVEFFYNSYAYALDATISFSLAALLYRSIELPPNAVFIVSPFGRWTLARCGIDRQSSNALLSKLTDMRTLETKIPGDSLTTIAHFVEELLHNDEVFAQFLRTAGVDKATLVGAANWCEVREEARIARAQWWSRENLGRIPGIAKDWAYGKTPRLDKFGRDLIVEARRQSASTHAFGKAEIELIETTLSRGAHANVLLVGTKIGGVMDIVYGLTRRIDLGTAYPELEHKRVMLLDTIALIASVKGDTVNAAKPALETLLVALFNEAARAGNLIIVFDEFATFVRDTQALGVEISALLAPYFSSQSIQFIAVSDPKAFHEDIETRTDLSRFFEKVLVKQVAEDTLIELVEAQVENIERRERVFFTYQALKGVAESAERYFAQGASFDKVQDLLSELVPAVKKDGKRVIEKEDVLNLVERKTGIPLGVVNDAEKDTLLNLETILHKRIIGQDEAVTAISNAMRRARSGVNSPNRPMGSFLFLGPTGVGKTETTKALAQSFFKDESQIVRFDMSEYRTEDALNRLIGFTGSGKQGILSSSLRDKQYGVLLLDEFEKTNKDVHDLFLQILDEGYFTDANGSKVNARNMIIIATSNAGSELIWKAMSEDGGTGGEHLEEKKSEIIDAIVEQGIFKPELLNRFDGVVLFHPLSSDDLGKVARLMLAKLNKRLEEKGIRVEITDELVNYLVEKGADQKFGARSMNRAIQEKVEQVVAERILKDEAKPGSVLTIRPGELA